MVSVRLIRRKIRTVRNIRQITDAMKRVAAARLQRAQHRVAASRPYAEKLAQTLHRVGAAAGEIEHPLLHTREPRTTCVVVVGSDRGLCGSYNGNLLRFVERFIASQNSDVKVVPVNRKACEYFLGRRDRHEVLRTFVGLSDQSPAGDVSILSTYLRDLYASEQVDEVYLCYQRFVSAVVQRPTAQRFLPFSATVRAQDDVSEASEYILEPDPQTIMLALIPTYVDTQIYHAILEAAASEYGSRMMAMTNATQSATDMIEDLTLTFNKARQAAITTELVEIVAGAEALAEQ
ncbi:MAG: ATP synthase F1 subunit gamma [Armatimonadetes bacterium]|nr:ATP synthase F1 subunit gamma [Armatimonadota bacterium]MDI9603581.1 ATP synthase F1 subunit gamma [Acidobacteriota bacterium]NLN90986.1 ATP synthase F1 subunit gamma [candidate division WS1 bacterium]